MEDLHRYFSLEAIKKLKDLNGRLQSADDFSESEKSELFRTLHTLKGSSQTFGFASASHLAHKLESLLSTITINGDFHETVRNLFVEGVNLLISSLENKHFEIPAIFVEKIKAFVPGSSEKSAFSEASLPELPLEISSQLSRLEKAALVAAYGTGKIVCGLEVEFDSANLSAGFKDFRQNLSQSGEIIATLPSRKSAAKGKIGFQIIFVSILQIGQVREIAAANKAEIIFETSETKFSNDLQGVLSQIVEHGKAIAGKFGKKIEFKVSADEIKLSNKQLKLVFDILIHLIRNAVDHAFESAGKIEISLRNREKFLELFVSDNGRGIDLEKLRAKAAEKNLVSADENLNELETLDLIFLPGFSTAAELTEISGRGIGLDAVKTEVESAHGRINVKSQTGIGTTFEIFLPKDGE